MIRVNIMPNGDIELACSQCRFKIWVRQQLSRTKYWPAFTGVALLRILGHYQ